ncbi:hypothetical protein JCM6882_003456 [Rhodosporidiobolus microsporus]
MSSTLPAAQQEPHAVVEAEGRLGGVEREEGEEVKGGHVSELSGADNSSARPRTSLLTLSAELYYHILGYLKDDFRSVALVGRTHSTFLSSARHTLYNTIELSFYHLDAWLQPHKGQKLFRTLEQAPHLAALPRRVDIWLAIADAPTMRDNWRSLHQEDIETEDGWNEKWAAKFSKKNGINLEERLRFALTLPNLQHLELTDGDDWYDFEPALRGRRYPSVTSLKIPAFTSRVASNFPSLRSLETNLAKITPPDDGSVLSPLVSLALSPLPSFSRISSSTLSASFAWLTSGSHTTLTSLTIPLAESFLPSLSPFAVLEILTITNADFDWTFSLLRGPKFLPKGTLPSFPPTLRTLRIGHLAETTYPASPFDMTSYLNPPPKPSPAPSPPPSLSTSLLANLSCPALTTLLIAGPELAASIYTELVADPSRLPSLEKVGVQAKWWAKHEQDDKPGVAWRPSEVEHLSAACAARGVAFQMVQAAKKTGRRHFA